MREVYGRACAAGTCEAVGGCGLPCGVSTGGRFATYALRAERDSGQIGLNGAAARWAALGDLLIICAYSQYTEVEAASHQPVVVRVDGRNRPLPDGR